ncbi:chromate efflux transporter [Oleispirillum naphthae]|uniref:chromate efflux transporter n=1 Tax=Oleispirillum naphthae TaxID=2838853 RepID=UPI0030825F6C
MSTESAGQPVSALVLFAAFLRLGLTGFGGPAMVSYIREMSVRRRRWISPEAFAQGIPLCQSIPGATAMQVAAYVGLRAGGPWGALAAYVGFGLPAFGLMAALSAAYQAGQSVEWVLAGFRGLQVIVVALVANAALEFGRASIASWRDAALAAGAAGALLLHGNPMAVIAATAALGVVLYRGQALPAAARFATAGDGGRVLRFAAGTAAAVVLALAALSVLDRRLFDLALLMMRVDVFAFGGGFASVPLMLDEVVNVRHWLDGPTFMDGIALGQVTPGPIVITATFVGYRLAGLTGAVAATIGVFAPSFLMVLLTVPHFDRLQGSAAFRHAVRGVLASFVGLLVFVTLHFGAAVAWSAPAGLIAAAALAALRLKADVLWVVLAGAAVSMAVF